MKQSRAALPSFEPPDIIVRDCQHGHRSGRVLTFVRTEVQSPQEDVSPEAVMVACGARLPDVSQDISPMRVTGETQIAAIRNR